MSFEAAVFSIIALIAFCSLCLGVLIGALIVIGFFPERRKSSLD